MATNEQTSSGGLVETIKTVAYAVIIALVVRTVAFEPFNIPSKSMVPTLLVGDYLFVSKYSYGYSRYSMPLGPDLFKGRILEANPPQRGDVVVFKLPTDNSTDYIKRLVGLPGDHIRVVHGILQINGTPIERQQVPDFEDRDATGRTLALQYDETLPNGKKHRIIQIDGDDGPADNTPEYIVPPDHYFMMGDNRDNSQDSRFLNYVGYVPAENLVGRAEFIFFSADGSAALWEVWKWPWAIRWNRFFTAIN